MICQYCQKLAEHVTGEAVYPYRRDLYDKEFWLCRPCNAYVGCHADGRPLGELADRKTRYWRSKAHAAFDPIWMHGSMPRKQAYSMLSRALCIPSEKTHIGMFDQELCKKTIAFASKIGVGGK